MLSKDEDYELGRLKEEEQVASWRKQADSGGIGSSDGVYHGHVALDSFGKKTYARKAFAEHGRQNYIEKKDGNWDGPYQGVILGKDCDYKVIFSQGIGERSGQTIIADGHLTESDFHRSHNHYGKNDKSKYPNEPDRIEDSSKHKNDNYYTGPGH